MKAEEEHDDESMSLFLDFVQAAQNQTPVSTNGQQAGAAHQNGLVLATNAKKTQKGAKGVRASVTVKGQSTSKGSRPWTPAEEHDLMKCRPRSVYPPEVLFLVRTHPAQSVSEYVSILAASCQG